VTALDEGELMISSIGTGSVAADLKRSIEKAEKADKTDKSIAEHVAASDEQDPIRSASTTQGTLVDTYL
jgi:hypothetical protein